MNNKIILFTIIAFTLEIIQEKPMDNWRKSGYAFAPSAFAFRYDKHYHLLSRRG